MRKEKGLNTLRILFQLGLCSLNPSDIKRAIPFEIRVIKTKCTVKWNPVDPITNGQQKSGCTNGEAFLKGFFKVHLTPNFFFGRDETLQLSHTEFDNIISIWFFK